MVYSCLHTHTELCDGSGTVNDYCEAAYNKKLVSLGFSAHAPLMKKIGFASDWHLKDDDTEEYCRLVRNAKKEWQGRLDVYLGLEVDYIKNYTGPADSDIKNLNLDYTIGSVHCILPQGAKIDWSKKYINEQKLLCVDGSGEELQALIRYGWNGDALMMVEAYWRAVIEMCRAGSFDILGHCDLIKKNNRDGKYFSPHDSRYIRCIHELSDVLQSSGIIVEINTGGLNRGVTNECYPSIDILKIFRKKNIPVTINADAHHTSHLGGHYDSARLALLEAGYTAFMLFTGRKDNAPVWTETPL
jgi:histidinol-phosphatase (PHP family)